jgi:hypothetical protein
VFDPLLVIEEVFGKPARAACLSVVIDRNCNLIRDKLIFGFRAVKFFCSGVYEGFCIVSFGIDGERTAQRIGGFRTIAGTPVRIYRRPIQLEMNVKVRD